MDIRQKTLQFIKSKKVIKSSDLAGAFGISRQYASQLLRVMANSSEIVKIGSTRNARYAMPQFADELGAHKSSRRFQSKGLKEHEVLENLVAVFFPFRQAPENVQSIFRYAFSEMLNNAIEHSGSPKIDVEIIDDGLAIKFIIRDFGIGVFRNVMKKRNLKSEYEAMQDLLKGKTTTAPQAHSGEGIFFTSKAADKYILESFGRRMTVDNTINDVFFEEQKPSQTGTRVIFILAKNSKRHLNDIFRKYQANPEDYEFNKTEIRIRLFTMGTVYISRSQARRVLAGLDKFKSILFDFDRVPTVGQAFADEIFRVFKNNHPGISLQAVNMNEAVKFMIERSQKG